MARKWSIRRTSVDVVGDEERSVPPAQERAGQTRRSRTTAASSASRGTSRAACCGASSCTFGTTANKRSAEKLAAAEAAGGSSGSGEGAGADTASTSTAGLSYGLGRVRQVIVKPRYHLHRGSERGIGQGSRGGGQPLRQHLDYLARPEAQEERDDVADEQLPAVVNQAPAERLGVFFDAAQDLIADAEVADLPARWQQDRHHWRIIVAPDLSLDERAALDLKSLARGYVKRLEKVLCTPLEWAGAVHVNTDHRHVHLLIRGRRDNGRDLTIKPEQIAHTLPAEARAEVVNQIGLRDEQAADEALLSMATKPRPTPLDDLLQRLSKQANGKPFAVPADWLPDQAGRHHLTARLATLERLGLAERMKQPGRWWGTRERWKLRPEWRGMLYFMGEQVAAEKSSAYVKSDGRGRGGEAGDTEENWDYAGVRSRVMKKIAMPILVLVLAAVGMIAGPTWMAHALANGRPIEWVAGRSFATVGIPLYHLGQVEQFRVKPPDAPAIYAIGFAITFGGLVIGVVIAMMSAVFAGPATEPMGRDKWMTTRGAKRAGLLADDGVICGRMSGTLLAFDGPEHHLIAGASRSGKGAGHVVPTLLCWSRSTLVYDVKGELWETTAGYRAALGDVLRFNPTDRAGACYNPLLEIRRGDHEVRDAQNVAEMLVNDGSKGGGRLGQADSIWDQEGTQLLTAMILHVLYAEPDGQKNLGRVRDLLMDIDETLRLMSETKHVELGGEPIPHPEVDRVARHLLGTYDKFRESVRGTCTSKLALWADPIVRDVTSRSDFTAGDLVCRDRPLSLYLQPPPADQQRVRPLVRLMLHRAHAGADGGPETRPTWPREEAPIATRARRVPDAWPDGVCQRRHEADGRLRHQGNDRRPELHGHPRALRQQPDDRRQLPRARLLRRGRHDHRAAHQPDGRDGDRVPP